MKKFWRKIIGSILAVLLSVYSGAAAQPQGGGSAQYIMQIITSDSKTSRMIAWLANEELEGAMVEYQRVGSPVFLHQPALSQQLRTNEGIVFHYAAQLENLHPGSAYIYRVGKAEQWSPWYRLETETGGAFKTLIFGDSQSVDYTVWQQSVQKAYEKNPDAQFFINMGDLVDNGEHWYQWQQWLQGAQPLLGKIPAAPIAGNHEAYSLQWKFTMPTTYLNLFALPQNGPRGLKGQVYSYDYGVVHFAVLDTQAEELAAYQPDLLQRQAEWLAADLAASKQRWKIVLMHRPAYGHLAGEAANQLAEIFMPIFERLQVDVVFQAHLHCYSRTGAIVQGKSAQRGPIYICTGRSGDDVWLENKQQALDQAFVALPDQPNYLTLQADKRSLTIQSFRQDGRLQDQTVLQK